MVLIEINNPASNYIFKVGNRNTRTRREICSKLTKKRPEHRQWCFHGVLYCNFEHISHLVLMLLLLTLSRLNVSIITKLTLCLPGDTGVPKLQYSSFNSAVTF